MLETTLFQRGKKRRFEGTKKQFVLRPAQWQYVERLAGELGCSNSDVLNAILARDEKAQSKTPSRSEAAAKRVQHLLDLLQLALHRGPYNASVSVDRIAEHLGYPCAHEVEKYIRGDEDPPFSFLKSLAKACGASENWLSFGEGRPFDATDEPLCSDPLDYIDWLVDISPQMLSFVRCSDDNGATTIVARVNEYKWVRAPRTHYISSNIGDRGRGQLLAFYQLIKTVQHVNLATILGKSLCKEEFETLERGEVHPWLLACGGNSTWWDDLDRWADTPELSDWYQRSYGMDFIHAQKELKMSIEARTKKAVDREIWDLVETIRRYRHIDREGRTFRELSYLRRVGCDESS